MARWLAIGVAPGWDDYEQFKRQLGESRLWRVDPQTSITNVTALGDGRLVVECDSPTRQRFEAWLAANAWEVHSISPIRYVARTGNVYNLE